MSTFQIAVLGIFSSLILVGVGVFAAFGGVLGGGSIGPVTIWGTLDQQTMQGLIEALRTTDKGLESVTYVQKSAASYEADLVNAMASGAGPDLYLLSGDEVLSFADKTLTIPFSAVSQGSYLSSFVDEAQIFLTPQGALALPFTLDPVVMYWNRDLFASAGVASPPSLWSEFLTLAPKITSLDANSTLRKSAVALGEWRNIPHAKDILAGLFMQVGDSIVARQGDGTPAVVLGGESVNSGGNPAESALRFYTEFANPTKTSYSWNRSLPSAPDAFVSGDVAMYFGFASEYASIAQRNPNLRFAAALLPQISQGAGRVTYGSITGLAVARTSKNPQGALEVAEKLSGKDGIGLISGALSLPPVRRDVGVDTAGSATAGVFVQSGLIARGWLDPNPRESDSVFQTMIESVVSGKAPPATAVAEGAQALSELLPGAQR
ncbi:MAG TPA: extracellular solute-binding protein [Candidatus Paceibacterota bacterium]|nr:extracellular solute-binding protein [Candidatus Paceibacterota bacterium]